MSIRLLSDNAVLPALHARGRGALPLSSLSQVNKQMLVCTLYNTLYSVHYSVYSYLLFYPAKCILTHLTELGLNLIRCDE